MAEIKIFANYGIPTREDQIVYTAYSPAERSSYSEEITVDVPEEFQAREEQSRICEDSQAS